MSQTGSPYQRLSHRWHYALLGGIASIPFTAAGYWQTGSELSLSPVLFGGLLAGYLATRNTGRSRGVGVRAGLVGGLPVLWVLADILRASGGLAGPSWFVASGVILTVVFTVAVGIGAFGLSALIGPVGAKVGSWLAASGGRDKPTALG